jgi:hypothetical protein
MPVGSRLIRAREKRIPLDDFEFRERVPMMDHETWRRNLMSVIRDLADSGYQERVWVRGAGPEVDSLSEAICRFFDDYDVDGFLAASARGAILSADQQASLKALRDALDAFLKQGKASDRRAIRQPK